ncbi:MAG: CpaD family pilus assembly protein [Alphaproteobacteria bacterium]|nr:CpaD family pilus assembly protein [Alphaproteobacteria bacterium]
MFGLNIGRIGYIAATLVMLSGCGTSAPMPEEELTERHKFKPEYQVEQSVHRYLVPVDPAKVDFQEQQRRDMYDFLVGIGAKPGDTVIVASRRERLDHRVEIVRFVRQLGLNPDMRLIKDQKLGDEDDGYGKAILIQFHSYVTREMDCGEWKQEYSTRFNNLSPPNFGCTNVSVMQQQVAYPSSLIAGDTLDFPEGDAAAASVSRYRGRAVVGIKTESAKGN